MPESIFNIYGCIVCAIYTRQEQIEKLPNPYERYKGSSIVPAFCHNSSASTLAINTAVSTGVENICLLNCPGEKREINARCSFAKWGTKGKTSH